MIISQERKDKIKYSMDHKKAFLRKEKQFLGKNTLSGYLHDLDKVLLYHLPFVSLKVIRFFHRKYASHHLPQALKSKKRKMQMVIDWECCRETKPDKPYTAVEIVALFRPDLKEELQPIFDEFGLTE